MKVDPAKIPVWVRRAMRRKSLLALGISITEQAEMSRRELDEILAVEDVIQKFQAAEQRKAARQSGPTRH